MSHETIILLNISGITTYSCRKNVTNSLGVTSEGKYQITNAKTIDSSSTTIPDTTTPLLWIFD